MEKLIVLTYLVVAVFAFSQTGDVNYIILDTRVDNINVHRSARVVFFVPVRDSLNFAGVNFRTVLLQAKLQEHIQRDQMVGVDTLDFITGALLDSINIGALYPKIEIIKFGWDLTNLQKRGVIDSRFNQLKSKIIKKFYAKYTFWGLERIVP